MKATQRIDIDGTVSPGFEPVRAAFVENFSRRHELGAACCVYLRGEKVVDLWGGVRKPASGEPWEADTMVIVFSATKGMSGLAMALAHSRGLFDYDQRVASYWPEFAQQGKDAITVRQLLAHQAGLFAFDELEDRGVIADLDRLAVVLAQQKPAWEPGTRQGYHAITLGYYEGELLRRVDPRHRTLGQYFQEEIATPLGLDFYIRLPESIPDTRFATLVNTPISRGLLVAPLALSVSALFPGAPIRRALAGSLLPLDDQRVYARNFEVPAGGGVGTARAIARAYGVFATGGKELKLQEETLRQLMAPAVAPTRGFRDVVLKVESRFALGFARPWAEDPFGSPGSFGHPGFGGSLGFADPENGIGFGYVCNRMDRYLIDPRNDALRRAVYCAIGVPQPYREGASA